MKKIIESDKLLSGIIFFLSISLLLIFNTPFAMAQFLMQDSFFSSNIITDQYSFWGDITRYSSSYGNQGGSYNNFLDSHIGGSGYGITGIMSSGAGLGYTPPITSGYGNVISGYGNTMGGFSGDPSLYSNIGGGSLNMGGFSGDVPLYSNIGGGSLNMGGYSGGNIYSGNNFLMGGNLMNGMMNGYDNFMGMMGGYGPKNMFSTLNLFNPCGMMQYYGVMNSPVYSTYNVFSPLNNIFNPYSYVPNMWMSSLNIRNTTPPQLTEAEKAMNNIMNLLEHNENKFPVQLEESLYLSGENTDYLDYLENLENLEEVEDIEDIDNIEQTDSKTGYKSGELLVIFNPSGTLTAPPQERIHQIHEEVMGNCSEVILGVEHRPLRKIENIPPTKCPIDLVILELSPDKTIFDAIEKYKGHPDIMWVEPNVIPNFNILPNDPTFLISAVSTTSGYQWNMDNKGQNIPVVPTELLPVYDYLVSLGYPASLSVNASGIDELALTDITRNADIDADLAWDILYPQGIVPAAFFTYPKVVAVIDHGVDVTHPDIDNNIWINPLEATTDRNGAIALDGQDNDGNGFVDDLYGWDFTTDSISATGQTSGLSIGGESQIDTDGHGTAISGIIAGEGNNGIGMAGINWGGAKIMTLKVLSIAEIIEAIDYAIANRANIINASWNIGSVPSLALLLEIRNARDAGILFVTGAGNDYRTDLDTTPSYPGSWTEDNIICVAGADNVDFLCAFSNYGATSVDLAAPGQSIYTTWSPLATYSYLVDPVADTSLYKFVSGCSFAGPHVAGAAAMVWLAYPTFTYADVKNAILRGAEANITLSGKTLTGGTLNVYNALMEANLIAQGL